MAAGSLNLLGGSPLSTYTEPITLAEAEHWLALASLSPVDAERDATINGLITGARELAENLQGRDLVRKQWELTLPCFPAEIELRDPLVSVDLVRYRDSDGNYTELTEGTDYIVDTAKHPGILEPPYGETWPSFTAWPTSAVLVRFTSGYAADDGFWSDAGARLKIAMKILVAHWFTSRAFELGAPGALEYPYTLTTLLTSGALTRTP